MSFSHRSTPAFSFGKTARPKPIHKDSLPVVFVSWFVNSFDSDVHAAFETSFESTCQRDALSPSYVSEWPDGSITKNDCLSGHVPAKADDWIYVRGWPTLRSR